MHASDATKFVSGPNEARAYILRRRSLKVIVVNERFSYFNYI